MGLEMGSPKVGFTWVLGGAVSLILEGFAPCLWGEGGGGAEGDEGKAAST